MYRTQYRAHSIYIYNESTNQCVRAARRTEPLRVAVLGSFRMEPSPLVVVAGKHPAPRQVLPEGIRLVLVEGIRQAPVEGTVPEVLVVGIRRSWGREAAYLHSFPDVPFLLLYAEQLTSAEQK